MTKHDEPAPQRAAQEGDLPPLTSDAHWSERIKTLMAQAGLPDSHSIYSAMWQLVNELQHDSVEYARLALAAAGGGVPQDFAERIAEAHDASLDDDHTGCRAILKECLRLLASSPQPEAAPAVAQVPEAAEQVELLDMQNHQLRRAIHAAMSRLSALLDEDQFAEMEQIFARAGVAAPEAPAQASAERAEPCPEPHEFSCKNRLQCWEPCGALGHDPAHAKPCSPETAAQIGAALRAHPEVGQEQASHCEHLRPMDKVCAPCRRYPNREAPAQADPLEKLTRLQEEMGLYDEAPAQAAQSAGEVEREAWLRELLRRSHPYVLEASTRYYDGTDGASIRQSAHALRIAIDAALSHKEPQR
jgi:hypothetical protein